MNGGISLSEVELTPTVKEGTDIATLKNIIATKKTELSNLEIELSNLETEHGQGQQNSVISEPTHVIGDTKAFKEALEEAIYDITIIVNNAEIYTFPPVDKILNILNIFEKNQKPASIPTNLKYMSEAIDKITEIINKINNSKNSNTNKMAILAEIAKIAIILEPVNKQIQDDEAKDLTPRLPLSDVEIKRLSSEALKERTLTKYVDAILKFKSNNFLLNRETEVNKMIDSILINIFQILRPHAGINIENVHVSLDILLDLLKVSLFGIKEVKVPSRKNGYAGIRIEISDYAKDKIKGMSLGSLKDIPKNISKFTRNYDSVIMHIAKREFFLQEGDLCTGNGCDTAKKLSILNLMKLISISSTSNLCWYFSTHEDFIKKLKKNPQVTDPVEIERLKVFEYILSNKLCDTIGGESDKSEWAIPDGYFASVITAIKNANAAGKLEYIGKNKITETDVNAVDARRTNAKSWFRKGGRTRKLRRRKTRKGKLRRRKTMQRKLRKR